MAVPVAGWLILSFFPTLVWGQNTAEALPPPDSISINWRSGLAFAPSRTPMQWSCQFHLSQRLASRQLELKYSLIRVSNDKKVLTGRRPVDVDREGNSPLVTINDLGPAEPDLYEFRCRLVDHADGVWDRLRREESTIATVNLPMIVQSDSSADNTPTSSPSKFSAERLLIPASIPTKSRGTDNEWKRIGTIRPSDPSWRLRQWIPQSAARVLPGMQRLQGELKLRDHAGEKICLIAPKSVFQTDLPISATGQPHRISIRLAANHAQQLRVDLGPGNEQVNATTSFRLPSPINHDWNIRPWDGNASPTSKTDSGVNHRGEQWVTHSFIHYCSGDDQIWLTNLSDSHPAVFESIEVFAGPERLPTQGNIDPSRRDHSANSSPASQFDERFIFGVTDLDWAEVMTTDWEKRKRNRQYDWRTNQWMRTKLAVERLSDLIKTHGAGAVAIPQGPDPIKNQAVVALFAAEKIPVWISINVHLPAAAGRRQQILPPSARMSLPSENIAGITIEVDTEEKLSDAQLERLLIDCELQFKNQNWSLQCSSSQLTPDVNEQIASRGGRLVQQINASAASSLKPKVNLNNPDSVRLFLRLEKSSTEELPRLGSSSAAMVRDALAEGKLKRIIIDVDARCQRIDPSLRELISAYRHLGHRDLKRIEPADEFDQTATVRFAADDDEAFLLITNHAPWTMDLEFSQFNGDRWDNHDWQVVATDRDADLAAPNRIRNDESNPHPWSIPAGSVLLLRHAGKIAPGEPESWRWVSSIAGGEDAVERIKQRVTTVVERLGMLGHPPSTGLLRNGGFELTGEVGMLGWLHAQYPPGCVAIDPSLASEGKQSVQMCTDSTITQKTWLVSEIIPAPVSGRLAVSLACRAEPSDQGKSHRIRVSIEGTRGETPFRETRDLEVPSDGQWQPRSIVLRTQLRDVPAADPLRLSIDSLSEGKIWIDQVVLHDNFATEQERSELQSQAFLAVQGLQRGQLTPSVRLLRNPWADVLLSTHAIADRSEPKPVPSTKKRVTTAPENPPGIAERFRRWLPRPLRF